MMRRTGRNSCSYGPVTDTSDDEKSFNNSSRDDDGTSPARMIHAINILKYKIMAALLCQLMNYAARIAHYTIAVRACIHGGIAMCLQLRVLC